MAYLTVKEVKQFGAQMLSEDELDTVLAGSTAEGTYNLIGRWLTRTFDRIAIWSDWKWLEDTISLTWPAPNPATGVSVLYLPDFVSRILSIPNDPHYQVEIIDAAQFDRLLSGNRITGGKDYLTVYGYYGVESDITEGTITVTSSVGASDDGLQVKIVGLTTTGNYEQIETVTLSSGTATTANSFKGGQGGVRDIEIVPTTVPTAGGGILTVTDSGATTIERLDASRERKHEHQRTELYAQAGGANAFSVRFYRRPFNVTADNDIIPIPHEFTDLMETGIMKELSKLRKEWGNVQALELEWRQRMREFTAWSNHNPGQRRVARPQRQWGYNNQWR